jgi:tetratricopeptide (TPR) repeat protein
MTNSLSWKEVARSLETPVLGRLEQELIDLNLLVYCQSALARRKAGTHCQAVTQTAPNVSWYRFLGARTQQHLGILYRETGRLDDALAATQAALDVCKSIVERHPADVTFALGLGSVVAAQGDVLRDLGRAPEALQAYSSALEQLHTALGEDVAQVDRQEYLLHARVGQALALAQLGKLDKAREALLQSPQDLPGRIQREIRLGRILVQAYAGDYVASSTEALQFTRASSSLSGRMYCDLRTPLLFARPQPAKTAVLPRTSGAGKRKNSLSALSSSFVMPRRSATFSHRCRSSVCNTIPRWPRLRQGRTIDSWCAMFKAR